MFIINKSASIILSKIDDNGTLVIEILGQKVGSKFYDNHNKASNYLYHNIQYDFSDSTSDIEQKVFKKGTSKIFNSDRINSWKTLIDGICGVQSCSLPESSIKYNYPILFTRGHQIRNMYYKIDSNVNNYLNLLNYFDGLNGANNNDKDCWVKLGMCNREQYNKCVELLSYVFNKYNYLEFIEPALYIPSGERTATIMENRFTHYVRSERIGIVPIPRQSEGE